ncbi:hypothetical protein GGS21DRAFT_238914 [Xylaria nigripes]|nr:hypothetical protein GGS21DRAFT_238914 [Xylaria nigripes]
MHTLLRSSAVRPHLEATRRLLHTPSNKNILRNARRQQFSSSPSKRGSLPETVARLQSQTPTNPTPEAKSVPIPVPNVVAPLSFWQRLGPITRAGQAYARAQRARPWVVQVASVLVIYGCADFGAQLMSSGSQNKACEGEGAEESERKHDWARTARSLAIGGGAAIPGYLWFAFLARSFNYSSKALSIAVKVIVNQLTFTPIFNIYFFGAQALLSGDTPGEAWRRVYNTVPVSFINSCKLWPAVTAFSFAFIPWEYRSVFSGVIAVGWQTYLSYLNSRAEMLETLRQKELQAVPSAANKVLPPGTAVQIVQALPGAKQAALA